mmetsp:Transcript_5355/g.18930  ORF Transcript_5355/g.18930 Transcript_5355/m.18930 type:complete len:235 (-) Transcript_5355:453-1157(-)
MDRGGHVHVHACSLATGTSTDVVGVDASATRSDAMRGGASGRLLRRRFVRHVKNPSDGTTPVEKIRRGESITWSEAARVLTEGRVERPLGWDWYAWNWFVSLIPTAVICLMAAKGRRMMEEDRTAKTTTVETTTDDEEEMRRDGLERVQERIDSLERQFAHLHALVEESRRTIKPAEALTSRTPISRTQDAARTALDVSSFQPSTNVAGEEPRSLLEWLHQRRSYGNKDASNSS